MTKTLAILALLCPVALFGQTAARYDLPALMTTPGGPQTSAPPALLAVKNATVSVCSCNPNAQGVCQPTLVNGMCTNTITTYTGASEATSCPSTAQLTMPGKSTCQGQTDLQGNLGFWYDQVANPHVVYTVKTTWGTSGPYDISQPNATGLPLTGGTISGVLQIKPTNPAFGTPASNYSSGAYLASQWTGTTPNPMVGNLDFVALNAENLLNSRPGLNRGALAVNSTGNPNWTVYKLFSLNLDNYGQGLSNSSVSEYHRGAGDTIPWYMYAFSNGNATQVDDEGTKALAATTGEGSGPVGGAGTYAGTVTTGGSGATSIVSTCTANCGTQGDGEYLLDLSQPTLSTYATAYTVFSGQTPAKVTINGTTAVSTAWGTLAADVKTPPGNPIGIGATSETFNVNVTSGTFAVGSIVCMAGQMHDQAIVTAVGTPSGGVQSVTAPLRQPHQSGSWIMQGPPCGTYLVSTAGIGDGQKYPVDVLGAIDSHTLLVAAFDGSSSNWIDYANTLWHLGTVGATSLSNSGTTVSFSLSGNQNVDGFYNGAPVITFSGASDSAFNTQCTSVALNFSTQHGTCTIAGLTGTHTAASANAAIGDTASGNGDLTLYPGAQILDVQNASNVVNGSFTLESNSAPWTAGDTVEAEHLPRAIFAGGTVNLTVHNPNIYSVVGVGVVLNGAGINNNSTNTPAGVSVTNNAPWSNYLNFGGLSVPMNGFQLSGDFNAGLWMRDAPGWGGYGVHYGPPHSGTADTGYYFIALSADCAAGTFNQACGMQFWPATNTWTDNKASDVWQFRNLQNWNAAAGVYRVAQTWNGTTRNSGHLVDYDANGDTQDSGVALSGVCQSNGTNCPVTSTIGNVTLVAGTATVTTSAACTVSGTCTYQLTNCGVGGTQGMLAVGTITAGTSFVINSSSNTDTSKVCWSILP